MGSRRRSQWASQPGNKVPKQFRCLSIHPVRNRPWSLFLFYQHHTSILRDACLGVRGMRESEHFGLFAHFTVHNLIYK